MKEISIKEALRELMNSRYPTKEEPDFDVLTSLGLPLTGAVLTANALLKKCTNGDVSAIKLLNDLTCEEKSDGINSDVLSGLSDAELLAMIEQG